MLVECEVCKCHVCHTCLKVNKPGYTVMSRIDVAYLCNDECRQVIRDLLSNRGVMNKMANLMSKVDNIEHKVDALSTDAVLQLDKSEEITCQQLSSHKSHRPAGI